MARRTAPFPPWAFLVWCGSSTPLLSACRGPGARPYGPVLVGLPLLRGGTDSAQTNPWGPVARLPGEEKKQDEGTKSDGDRTGGSLSEGSPLGRGQQVQGSPWTGGLPEPLPPRRRKAGVAERRARAGGDGEEAPE